MRKVYRLKDHIKEGAATEKSQNIASNALKTMVERIILPSSDR